MQLWFISAIIYPCRIDIISCNEMKDCNTYSLKLRKTTKKFNPLGSHEKTF